MAKITQINPDALTTALEPINNAIAEKQDKATAAEEYAPKSHTHTKSEITDFPAMPTVNDPKVSIKMNGAEKGSFTLNQAAAGEVDLGTVITSHQDISGKVDKTLNAKSLEAITIYYDNTEEHKAANKAAIKAYIDNLTALGVDTTKNFNIPISAIYYGNGYLTVCRYGESYIYTSFFGILFTPDIGGVDARSTIVKVNYNTGEFIVMQKIYNDETLATTNKSLVGAINEVNTLAKKKQDTLTSGTDIKTIDGESLLGAGDIKIKNNDYYLPVSAFSGQTAVTQDVLDAIVDVRNSQGRKHLYIYDESTAVGAVAEASVANWFSTYEYFVSWMAYYGDGYNTIWAYLIVKGTKAVTDVSFRVSKFRGATKTVTGGEGIVPAPTTADTESFLCGNGKWEKVSGGSSAFVLDPNNYKFSELVDAVFANKIIMLKDFLLYSHAYSIIAAPMDVDGSIVTTVAETKYVYCAFMYIGATQGSQVTQVAALKFTGDNKWADEPNSAGRLLCTDDYKVDTSMSDTSTNPVQNKVIKAYIDGLVGNVAAQLAQI